MFSCGFSWLPMVAVMANSRLSSGVTATPSSASWMPSPVKVMAFSGVLPPGANMKTSLLPMVVPAAIWGTHQILRKGSLVVHPHPAALVIGAPLETEGLSRDDRDSLTTAAFASVSSSLERAKTLVSDLQR